MSKSKEVPACMPERYVDLGMVVNWFPSASMTEKGIPAVVVGIGLEAIDLVVLHPGIQGTMAINGAHHGDYQTKKVDGEGCWRHTDIGIAMLKSMIFSGALVWDGEKRYKPSDKWMAMSLKEQPISPTIMHDFDETSGVCKNCRGKKSEILSKSSPTPCVKSAA